MSIKDRYEFARVVIENNYTKIDDSSDNLVEYKSIDDSKYASYNLGDFPFFYFEFKKSVLDGSVEIPNTPYDNIYKKVKEKCEWAGIKFLNDVDYSFYECGDAQYKGMIGFTIWKNKGLIALFNL